MKQNISIKNHEEINKMRISGKLAAEVLEMVEQYVQPGVTTDKLNEICHDYIVNYQQAIPAPLNYLGNNNKPFPKSICTSVNHEICHGIPGNRILKNGDIINIDVTVIKDGFHGDTSKMFFVGEPSILAKKLVSITQECLYLAIKALKPGINSNIIGTSIQTLAEQNNFSVVREYCGHGIGKNFHEEPQVLHFATKNPDNTFTLKEGMTFTIEPMINSGTRFTKIKPDGWTVVTKDHSLSAQWEHTILITKTGAEVLTKRSNENI
jgi:methionyl aminopeptidase